MLVSQSRLVAENKLSTLMISNATSIITTPSTKSEHRDVEEMDSPQSYLAIGGGVRSAYCIEYTHKIHLYGLLYRWLAASLLACKVSVSDKKANRA